MSNLENTNNLAKCFASVSLKQKAKVCNCLLRYLNLTSKCLFAKGQLVSKCLFGIFNSPKKRTKKFDFTTMVPLVELLSFVFWEN